MRPSGILDLFSSAFVVGTALSVQRWYDGSALAFGFCEMHALAGSLISGGGRSRSLTLGCAPLTLTV